jgi:hypothetical protein
VQEHQEYSLSISPVPPSLIYLRLTIIRVLATLDIRNNSIPSDQKANLRRICKSKKTNLKL